MKKSILTSLLIAFLSLNANSQQLPFSAEDVKPLKIGSKIPNSKIVLSKNGDIDTDKLFSQKPTILVVYRGGWCPFCNRQLSGLNNVKNNLIDLGYQIVTVSPDSQSSDESIKYAEDYLVGSDSNTQLIRNLGIAYQAPDKYSKILSKASKGMNTSVIPAPSVFIVDTEGKIVFKQVSKDFKKRISEDILLSIAEGYQEK